MSTLGSAGREDQGREMVFGLARELITVIMMDMDIIEEKTKYKMQALSFTQ